MRRWTLALAASGGAFVLLAALVFGSHELAFEHFWADPLRAYRGPITNQLALWLTNLGSGWVLGVLCLAVLPFLKDRWEQKALVAVYLLNLLGNLVLKQLFQRARPGDDFDPLVHERFYSFPSGHSMASMAIWGFLAWLLARHGKRAWAAAALAIPFLVGFTRIYLGAHYPTDVLGGFLVGLVVIAVVQLTRGVLPDGDRNGPFG